MAIEPCDKGDAPERHSGQLLGQFCEKGGKNRIVETKLLPPEADRVAQMFLHMRQQHADAVNPTDYGMPDETEREDGVPRLNGQAATIPFTSKDIVLWRPGRPGFEDRTNPVKVLVNIGDDDDHACLEAIQEEALRTWPDLHHCFWIHVPVWASWTSTTGLDVEYEQMVVIDSIQFAPYTNWRGGIINVEIGGPPPAHIDIDVGPLATRVPLLYADLMVQMQIEEDFFEAYVFVNGIPVRPESPGLIFGHGFYMEVVLRAKPEDSDGDSSEILNDLLRTPSQGHPAKEEKVNSPLNRTTAGPPTMCTKRGHRHPVKVTHLVPLQLKNTKLIFSQLLNTLVVTALWVLAMTTRLHLM